jgi:hypothetical protein
MKLPAELETLYSDILENAFPNRVEIGPANSPHEGQPVARLGPFTITIQTDGNVELFWHPTGGTTGTSIFKQVKPTSLAHAVAEVSDHIHTAIGNVKELSSPPAGDKATKVVSALEHRPAVLHQVLTTLLDKYGSRLVTPWKDQDPTNANHEYMIPGGDNADEYLWAAYSLYTSNAESVAELYLDNTYTFRPSTHPDYDYPSTRLKAKSVADAMDQVHKLLDKDPGYTRVGTPWPEPDSWQDKPRTKVPPGEGGAEGATSPADGGTRHTLSSGSRAYTPPGTPQPGTAAPMPSTTTDKAADELLEGLWDSS